GGYGDSGRVEDLDPSAEVAVRPGSADHTSPTRVSAAGRPTGYRWAGRAEWQRPVIAAGSEADRQAGGQPAGSGHLVVRTPRVRYAPLAIGRLRENAARLPNARWALRVSGSSHAAER